MRDFVDGTVRNRLDRAGVPRSLARGIRGLYLDEIVRDPTISVAQAAANVGTTPTNVRKMRFRLPEPRTAPTEEAVMNKTQLSTAVPDQTTETLLRWQQSDLRLLDQFCAAYVDPATPVRNAKAAAAGIEQARADLHEIARVEEARGRCRSGARSERHQEPRPRPELEGTEMTDWDVIQDDELQEHLAMAQGLLAQDEDFWTDYATDVQAEVERRAEASKAAEAQRRRRERARYEASAEGKLAALRKDLKEAEETLANAEKSPTSSRLHPDLARDADPVNAARFAAAATVTHLKQKIALSEKRLPFHDTDDNALVDEAATLEAEIAPLREQVAALDRQQRESGIKDTSFSAQSARRHLEEAQAKLKAIVDEVALRRRDARNEALVRDRQAKVAMRMRQESLEHWRAESKRLRSYLDDPQKSGMLDVAELQRAEKNLREVQAYIDRKPPPSKDELARAAERIAQDTSIRRIAPGVVQANWV